MGLEGAEAMGRELRLEWRMRRRSVVLVPPMDEWWVVLADQARLEGFKPASEGHRMQRVPASVKTRICYGRNVGRNAFAYRAVEHVWAGACYGMPPQGDEDELFAGLELWLVVVGSRNARARGYHSTTAQYQVLYSYRQDRQGCGTGSRVGLRCSTESTPFRGCSGRDGATDGSQDYHREH